MFRRKLQALEYPAPQNFNCDDDSHFQNLVLWLEEHKIRHYNLDEREGLRNISSLEWPTAFQKYLKDLEIEHVGNLSKPEITDQLLAAAVRCEYSDNKEKYSEASSEIVNGAKKEAPKIVATNPLDTLDFNNPDFVKGVDELAKLLKITRHPDHLITLEACATLINKRYSKEAIKNGNHVLLSGAAFPFQNVDPSFETGDPVLNKAAKILRLLFIGDLRDLQTKINECIVAVQSVSANPKTDIRLGKVGY